MSRFINTKDYKNNKNSGNSDDDSSNIKIIYNNDQIDMVSTGATIHSGKKDETQFIYVTPERPVNMYKNQIYLKVAEKENIHYQNNI